jgi:4-amino-4-deoxy-L-arabinose transferase-like glycosyltransferase
LGWLLLGGIIVGLGFNIKMMQAFLPLPAFYARYFFGSKLKWGRKLVYLLLTTLILVVVSLSWTVVVDLTPVDQRPYIGSSTDNTVMGLILEHNGISRLESNNGPKTDNPQKGEFPANAPQADINPAQDAQIQPGARQVPPAEAVDACSDLSKGETCSVTLKNGNTVNGSCINAPNSNSLVCAPQGMIPQNGQAPSGQPPGGGVNPNAGSNPQNGQPPAGGQILNDGPNAQGGGTPFNNETGDPGLLRFFTSPLSKQMSWLLPFALISVLLAAFSSKIKLPIESSIHKALVLWGGWLLTCVVFFSIVSGIFHSYYAIMLAPALGAMVGIGFSQLWFWKDTKWAGIVLAVSATITIAYQFFAASQYGEFSWWLLAVGLLLGLGLLLLVFKKRLAYFVLLVSMLVIPFYWTAMTIGTDANQNLPTAYEGSSAIRGNAAPAGQRPDGGQTDINRNTDLIDYLVANTQDVEYLVAVPSSQQGSQMVLATGRPVLYMGGFNGGDDVVNADDLSAMTASGEVQYVYYGANGKADITRWLQSTCSVVSQFSQSTTNRPVNAVQGPNDQTMTLYMCQ